MLGAQSTGLEHLLNSNKSIGEMAGALDAYLNQVWATHEDFKAFYKFLPTLNQHIFGYRGWMDEICSPQYDTSRYRDNYDRLVALLSPSGALFRALVTYAGEPETFSYEFPTESLPRPTKQKLSTGDFASLPMLYAGKLSVGANSGQASAISAAAALAAPAFGVGTPSKAAQSTPGPNGSFMASTGLPHGTPGRGKGNAPSQQHQQQPMATPINASGGAQAVVRFSIFEYYLAVFAAYPTIGRPEVQIPAPVRRPGAFYPGKSTRPDPFQILLLDYLHFLLPDRAAPVPANPSAATLSAMAANFAQRRAPKSLSSWSTLIRDPPPPLTLRTSTTRSRTGRTSTSTTPGQQLKHQMGAWAGNLLGQKHTSPRSQAPPRSPNSQSYCTIWSSYAHLGPHVATLPEMALQIFTEFWLNGNDPELIMKGFNTVPRSMANSGGLRFNTGTGTPGYGGASPAHHSSSRGPDLHVRPRASFGLLPAEQCVVPTPFVMECALDLVRYLVGNPAAIANSFTANSSWIAASALGTATGPAATASAASTRSSALRGVNKSAAMAMPGHDGMGNWSPLVAIQLPLFRMLYASLSSWPAKELGDSFFLIIRVWLSYITPWQSELSESAGKGGADSKVAYTMSVSEFRARWAPYLLHNYAFYSTLLDEFFGLALHLELASVADQLYILDKVVCALGTDPVMSLIWEADSVMSQPALSHRSSGPSTPRRLSSSTTDSSGSRHHQDPDSRPASKPGGTAPQSLVAEFAPIIHPHLAAMLAPPMDYHPLGRPDSKIIRSVQSVVFGLARAREILRSQAEAQWPSAPSSPGKMVTSWLLDTPAGHPEQLKLKKEAESKRKRANLTMDIEKDLRDLFDLAVPPTSAALSPNSARGPSGGSIGTPLSLNVPGTPGGDRRAVLMRGPLRKRSAPETISFKGDRRYRPIESLENAFLVRNLVWLSDLINVKVGLGEWDADGAFVEAKGRFMVNLRPLGSYAILIQCVFVYFFLWFCIALYNA